MSIKKSAYGGMDWVDALSASKKKTEYDSASGPEDTQNALEKTVEAAFKVPTSEPTSEQAISHASRDIHDKAAAERVSGAAQLIRDKLASRGIDPVKLGMASEDDWKKSIDPEWATAIAKKAALAHEKQAKEAWQNGATNPVQHSMKYEPGRSRDGMVMSCTAAGEDSNPKTNRVPANANSIADPNRLDKLAAAPNEHDASREEAKKRDADRAGKRTREAMESMASGSIPADQQLNDGRIMKSGGTDSEVFVHKVPKGQISVMDNIESLPPDQLKEKLASIFNKVPDTRTEIRQANEQRKEGIQGKKQADRSWEKTEKGKSVSDIQQKLMDMWIPREGK
jgi:hypothetical protein